MALLTPKRRLVVSLALICLGGVSPRAEQPAPAIATPIEANLKAVFLYNFSKYVTWPETPPGERQPDGVRICVTANDNFFELLKAVVQGEDIDGKPLVAVALDGLDAAKTCQILYVRDAQSADGKAWLTAVRGLQVVTVADGALTDETVIAFVRESNRIRFDINRAAGTRRNLNISSKLLRLARQVKDR